MSAVPVPYTPTFVLGGRHTAQRLALVSTVVLLAALVWAGTALAGRVAMNDNLSAEVTAGINAVRAKHGLRRLKYSIRLTRAARAHVTAMGRKGFFSHSSAGGASFGHRLQSYYGSKLVGEVIYWQQGAASAAQVVWWWLGSSPHRAQLLARRWRDIGVGAVFVRNAPGVFRGRDVTIVVADFGTRR